MLGLLPKKNVKNAMFRGQKLLQAGLTALAKASPRVAGLSAEIGAYVRHIWNHALSLAEPRKFGEKVVEQYPAYAAGVAVAVFLALPADEVYFAKEEQRPAKPMTSLEDMLGFNEWTYIHELKGPPTMAPERPPFEWNRLYIPIKS